MDTSIIKKLFTKKWFIILFTFTVELIFNYLFEVQHIGGYYIYADIALGPIFGLMFGPMGALGFALGTLVGELVEGIGLPAPFIDFIITFFISALTYRLWYTTFNRGKKDTPRFNSTYNIIKFLSITILISIVYFSFLVISFSLFHNLNYSYSISDVNFNVPYMLNIITFTIIFGLLLISSFNILKIPLQTPKKRISKININQNYLLAILLICTGYFLFKELIMNIKSVRHFFTFVTIITSILLYFNTFDVKVEPTYVPKIDPSYQILIILSFTSVFILLVSLIYIRFVEKTITNPLYDMINTADNYFKTKNKVESVYKLKKYITNDDSIGLLANSFVTLYDKIRTNLNQLQITTSEKEKFKTEFDVASQMQSNMLPKNFDELTKNESFEIYAYMKPASEVGGDFYDYFKIDEDHVYFVIGDVSGKGIPSTLFMVKTMYLIENHTKFNEDLSQVIEKVNNLAYERNDEELFVTIWLGKLNLKTGKLSYVNAGHNQPLIKQDSNNFEYMKTHPNLVLGGMEGIQYNEHEINLNAGDMIFLYTDGVTEANDNYNGFYGENRLKETINENKNKKLNDIINEITKDIDKFCNNSEQYDDITMLIIKYNGWVENGL